MSSGPPNKKLRVRQATLFDIVRPRKSKGVTMTGAYTNVNGSHKV